MKLFSLLSLICFSFISLNSYGVNLSKRVAIGAGDKGLSLRYYAKPNLAFSTFLHFHNSQFEKDVVNSYSVWAKMDYIFRAESYMNFYYSAAFNYRGASLEVQALGGGELFFENWPNLSFIFELGLSFLSSSGHLQIKTVQYLPFSTGIYYYF